MRRMVTVDREPTGWFTWRCPDCGKHGRSATHHGALNRLRAHWRTCPDPRTVPSKKGYATTLDPEAYGRETR